MRYRDDDPQGRPSIAGEQRQPDSEPIHAAKCSPGLWSTDESRSPCRIAVHRWLRDEGDSEIRRKSADVRPVQSQVIAAGLPCSTWSRALRSPSQMRSMVIASHPAGKIAIRVGHVSGAPRASRPVRP